ncbi:hypothetical protein H0H92_001411 [Tricholoma furcatifolium]|nr:hypothetical protein H0H92_001411 [Tricholoma furcatifolium]
MSQPVDPLPPWTPESWKEKPVAQPVSYPDDAHLERVLSKISELPPLVTPSEIERLRHQLSLVQRNEAFILHAGDCAESFDACRHSGEDVRIGRIAGQYAKPRSSSYERIGDREVLSFRGDNVNGLDVNDRTPDPERLLKAYFHSATTLNYVRGLLSSGFASLHHPRDWSLAHVRSPALRQEFSQIIDALGDALDFSRTIGVDAATAPYERGGAHTPLGEVDFYTSHEGLMLAYEQALTRSFPVPGLPPMESRKAYYNTSAHFLWIGDRTRQLTGAHVEYFRGIRNPIGIKVGPSMQGDELVRLLETWICDPMHGNTQTSSSGLKTRHFGTIISEIVECLRIHTEHNSRLGGVSLEFTGELNGEGFSVTECVGGSMELGEEELGLRYQSFCDPRLNFEQSLDVAFLISNHYKKERRGRSGERDVLYSELAGRFANAQ